MRSHLSADVLPPAISYPITATYTGDSRYQASNSATLNQTIVTGSVLSLSIVSYHFPHLVDARHPAHVKLLVRNDSDQASGINAVALFTSLGPQISSTILSQTAEILRQDRRIPLAPQESKTFSFKLANPATGIFGKYFLIAGVTDFDKLNQWAATEQPIPINFPIARIEGTFDSVKPSAVKTGHSVVIALHVTDIGGNDQVSFRAQIKVGLSPHGSDSVVPYLATVMKSIKIAPGATKGLRIRLRVPKSQAPGAYDLVGLLLLAPHLTFTALPEGDAIRGTVALEVNG